MKLTVFIGKGTPTQMRKPETDWSHRAAISTYCLRCSGVHQGPKFTWMQSLRFCLDWARPGWGLSLPFPGFLSPMPCGW